MQSKFSFISRSECICGAPLQSDCTTVIKRFPQGDVTFLRCASCHSYIQSPCLDNNSLAQWYDSPEYQGNASTKGVGYINYLHGEPQRRIEARRRYIRDIGPYLPPDACVLEVGAATGALLAEIRNHGNRSLGCDLSERFAAYARDSYDLDIAVADWLNLDIEAASLDAIILLGTISNLTRLNAALLNAKRQLKHDGFLFFNYPAADAWPARLYGNRMWMFTPSVMQFMTHQGVALALANAGFYIDTQGTDRQAPTLSKLLGHARLGFGYPLLKLARLKDAALPFDIPLPGIIAVRARLNQTHRSVNH